MFTKRMSKLTTRAKEELERLREAERTTSEHLIEVLSDVLHVTTETQDPASSDQQIREVLNCFWHMYFWDLIWVAAVLPP